MTSPTRPATRTGRGAVSNPAGRFESTQTEAVDDGWGSLDEELPPLATVVQPEPAERRLWLAVRDEVAGSATGRRDAARLTRILSERHLTSQRFFASAAGS